MTSVMDIDLILSQAAPVIPVLVINRIEDAVPLAQALVDGGVCVLEVTLRTPIALDVIKAMKSVKGAIVGAGTVINRIQIEEVEKVGADFIVSPGFSVELVNLAKKKNIPLLPGVATASEIMAGINAGVTRFKFYPAEAIGGVRMLKAFSGPFPQISFCATGGISAANYKEYLSLTNVSCVGGSWIATDELINSGNWSKIQANASGC